MKNVAKWIVVITGMYDLLIGVAMIASANPSDPAQRTTWALTLMLSGFLLFCGAVLIWAAQDLHARGAVVFWQGLLRLWAVGVLFAGIRGDFYPVGQTDVPRVAAIIDAAVAVFYFVALLGVWRLSPLRLLLGRSSLLPAER